jgi:peptidoglycan/LPS O-acetylase OafA/YrhL
MSEMRDMPSEKPPLSREHLLALEPQDPALRAEYERKLNAMLEVPLSKMRRAFLIAVLVMCVGMIALFVTLMAQETLPWKIRGVFSVGILFAGGWIAYLVRILRHGAMRRKTDPWIAAFMGWMFTIITATAFALLSPHKDPFVIFCFLFLLPAAVVLLGTQTEQAEIRTQEKLLELEYKLARIGETLEKNGK